MRSTTCRRAILLLSGAFAFATANVEKVIFAAPAPAAAIVPGGGPKLESLDLYKLSSENSAIRTELARSFPNLESASLGRDHWVLIDGVESGWKYEFRVCWAALEPTSFILEPYGFNQVWETPELLRSLNEYSASRKADPPILRTTDAETSYRVRADTEKSALLVRIRAAADYYTDNAALMANPPPVLVDLILDPYIFNVIPRSAISAIGFVMIVGMILWHAAPLAAAALQDLANLKTRDTTKKDN